MGNTFLSLEISFLNSLYFLSMESLTDADLKLWISPSASGRLQNTAPSASSFFLHRDNFPDHKWPSQGWCCPHKFLLAGVTNEISSHQHNFCSFGAGIIPVALIHCRLGSWLLCPWSLLQGFWFWSEQQESPLNSPEASHVSQTWCAWQKLRRNESTRG